VLGHLRVRAHSALYLQKNLSLVKVPLICYVVLLKGVLRRLSCCAPHGEVMHVPTNVFRIPHTARELTAKWHTGWSCGSTGRGSWCARYFFNSHVINKGSHLGDISYNVVDRIRVNQSNKKR
jgi:hypothetical protein